MESFRDFCIFNGFAPGSREYDSFVGVRFENGKPQVFFPLGYFASDGVIDDSDLRQGFYNLISVLGDKTLTDVMQGSLLQEGWKQSLEFPMQAYMEVMRFYLDFGYYTETEVSYKIGHLGKINWNRTIKTIQPQVSEFGDDNPGVVYLDFVTRQNNYQTDNLISWVHKFCVFDGVQKIGLFFGISDVDEPELEFDYNLFAGTIQEKISKTFSDVHLNLFNAMLQIVEYLARRESQGDRESTSYTYGVSTFAPIWENMVERIFGTECREDYYPNCGWVIADKEVMKTEMRPDTIMVVDDNLFVIDSKYYSYGVDGRTLPQSESITKQLAYAEYAEKKTGKQVYNVFVMPYCGGSKIIDYLGYAHCDWKNAAEDSGTGTVKAYHRIHGILLDTKFAMTNYRKNAELQRLLSVCLDRGGVAVACE